MSSRFATLLGIVGAAALSIWFGKRRHPQASGSDGVGSATPPAHIEDDHVADIIRRAQPALERAGRLAAAWNN